jgi:hypothetical protein
MFGTYIRYAPELGQRLAVMGPHQSPLIGITITTPAASASPRTEAVPLASSGPTRVAVLFAIRLAAIISTMHLLIAPVPPLFDKPLRDERRAN